MTNYTYTKLMGRIPKEELDCLWEKERAEEKSERDETEVFIHRLMDKISELTPNKEKDRSPDNLGITGFSKKIQQYQDSAYWEQRIK